jgi:orotate phosphoribosyltransferase
LPVTENDLAQLVALLRERSVQTGDFTLASGRKSSYYIDARRTTMSARGLELIGQAGLAAIRSAGWRPSLVGGLTLGADPVAYAIARASRDEPPVINGFTIRKEPKAHGAKRQIEGCFESGASVVVIEDVITTGQSALRAVEAVRSAGSTVEGVLAVVDREEGGRTALAAAGLPVVALVTLADLGVAAPPTQTT